MQGYLLACFGLVVVDFLQTEQSTILFCSGFTEMIQRDFWWEGAHLGLVLLLVNVLLVQNYIFCIVQFFQCDWFCIQLKKCEFAIKGSFTGTTSRCVFCTLLT